MQKPQPSQLPPSIRKLPATCFAGDAGFGMMEVLIAMTLIAGAYMGVVESYQRLRLQYGQIEAQRTQLNQAQDEHERGTP